ncbi:DUF1985 domain-containing protein [Abeliophyllum distichum]|uniref:DUF1985 domain-containing protein n=1 Tax=Abeliophyllum distichum TaxID=126358 RepID=A0ABD1PDT2_9LAMI
MRRIKFSGQLIHQLLNRLVKCDKEDELWFCFRDKPARFSLKEWALITGLNCGTGPDRKHMEYVRRTNRLLYHYFEGKSHITTKELEVAFAKCQDMRDKFKLGLVLFLESVLFCPDRRASIQLASLSIVEDLDLFYSCPWGKESFRRTIVTFKRDWRAKSKELKSNPKPSRFKYSLHGFPLALQVWAYEAMPHVGRQFASKFQHKVPRMVCWDATIAPTSSEISDVLNGHKLIVYCIIRPTDEENSKKYMRDFSPFESASRDRRFDEIIDNLDDYVPPGFEAPREREIYGMAGHSACEANLGDMEGSATHGSYLTPRFSPRHQDAPSDEGPSHIPQPRGVYLTQKEFNRRVSHIEKRFATLEQRISKEIDSVRSYCGVIEKKVDTVIELLQNSNTSRGFDHQSRYEHHSGYDHQDGNEHHNSFEHQSVYEDEG